MRAVGLSEPSPAASSHLQRGSRAAHVTAKAAPGLTGVRHALGQVPSGYGERHVRKGWFGTGETRLASLVSKDRRDKPVVKLDGGKRESDGIVVPLIAGKNPAGGNDPDFGHTGDGGKREGMPGTAPDIYPEGKHLPPAKVRRLQNRLWAAAKQSSGWRFHSLYDRIYRSDVLREAWERVRANRGAAGVDGVTLAVAEAYGFERMIAELQESLRSGIYRTAHRRAPRPLGHAEVQTITARALTGMGPAGRCSRAQPQALRPLATCPDHHQSARGRRMTRECHVRFCESGRGRFPPATHLKEGWGTGLVRAPAP